MVMSFGMAILVLLVVWVAVRAVGPAEASRQPTVALPSMPQVAVEPAASSSSLSPSPSFPASSAVSSSAVPSRSVSSSPSPSPSVRRATSTGVPEGTHRPTTKPTPTARRTTTPPPAPSFAVSISVSGSWQFGYTGRVTIENQGSAARDWRITVAHSDVDHLRLWGARGSLEGDNVVFTGPSLKPGASASFQYSVTKTGRGNARPSGCSVVGGTCRVG
jgi:cellulase/cellobiase CelA1